MSARDDDSAARSRAKLNSEIKRSARAELRRALRAAKNKSSRGIKRIRSRSAAQKNKYRKKPKTENSLKPGEYRGLHVERGRRPGIIRKSGSRIRGLEQFKRSIEYGCKPEKGKNSQPYIVSSNVFGIDVRSIIKEFEIEYRRHPNLSEVVVHEILSWHPSRVPTDDEMQSVIQLHLNKAGFENCLYLAVRHFDSNHHHVHIYVSRSRPDETLVSLSQNWSRWSKNLSDVESELNLLEPPPPSTERLTNKAHQVRRRSARQRTQDPTIDPSEVREAINASHDFEQLQHELNRKGIELAVSRRQDGVARGLLLKKIGAEEWLSGSSIARDLSLSQVRDALANKVFRPSSSSSSQMEFHRLLNVEPDFSLNTIQSNQF